MTNSVANSTFFTLLSPASKQGAALARRWLHIGVFALLIGGIFSLMPVVARMPAFKNSEFIKWLFHETIVIHVDLLVLGWVPAIACMLWSLLCSHKRPLIPMLEQAAQYCFILGIIGITASVFDPAGEALMSNYIPVIMSPVFFLGLALLLCGVALMVVHVCTSAGGSDVVSFGVASSAIITLIAFMGFVWSYHLLPPEIDGQQYYEMLFWGGGHVLQFTHTQLLVVCWLWLALLLKPAFNLSSKLLYVLFAVGVVSALVSPLAYILFDITSGEFRQFFTHQMIAAGGIAPAIMALCVLPVLWSTRGLRKGEQAALWSVLLMSVLLFLYGGFLGLMIQGQNVVIPAHYHGSIVGITLAFMGMAYALLPRFGYASVSGSRLAYWQPIAYGIGQVMHISGLAWMGGYGVLRKTAGAAEEMPMKLKMAYGLMGLGGLIAIIGGLLFIIVMINAFRKKA